ncbi:LysR family transcriptional regulator [Archangium gephyra]|nr:LysR family transcriptional regulator [Archangium gephyra]
MTAAGLTGRQPAANDHSMQETDLNDLRNFVAVYQAGSFTAAAKRLKVSKVAVAKRLGLFEARLHYRLFRRSTRRLAPTPEAEQLYGHALQLLQHVREFEAQLSNASPMEGVVRVTCSYSMAMTFVGELLVTFQRKHPGLRMELISTDSVLDLIEHNIDLAFRIGNLTAQSMVGRKLGTNDIVLCASPAYLKSAAPLKALSDIKNHPVFCMNYHLGLEFAKTETPLADVMGQPRLATNEGELVTKLGLGGHGLIVRSKWAVKRYLEDGSLVEVLPKFPLTNAGDIWLVSSAGRMQSARIRAVFEMFIEESRRFL